MKSRHAVKQGLRCLHGVVCLKLWIHYSSNLVKRQQLREHGQEPIKTEYSRQGRLQQGTVCRSGFCLKICIFPKSRAGEIAEKQHSFESRAGEIAKQAAHVNGQDERFAPLIIAARRAFWQTRRADTACACPPVNKNWHLWILCDVPHFLTIPCNRFLESFQFCCVAAVFCNQIADTHIIADKEFVC